MSTGIQPPSAGYNFNAFQEIKSHSSILYNERMAILFYLLDMHSISLNKTHSLDSMLEVRSLLKQIYKNIRMLFRYNPTMRATLNLDTKDDGIYTTDVIMGIIDKMVEYCENSEYTTKRLYILTQKLNEFEIIIKDVLQYYHYFIRPDFKQKPDIELATEKYKEIADRRTIDELRDLVGKSHKIDFGGLGSSRIELQSPNDDDLLEDNSEYDEEDLKDEEPEVENKDEVSYN